MLVLLTLFFLARRGATGGGQSSGAAAPAPFGASCSSESNDTATMIHEGEI